MFMKWEEEYLSQFTLMEVFKPGFYRLMNYNNSSVCFVVDYVNNKKIWVFMTLDATLTRDEFDVNENLAHLIAYYLNKHQSEFNKVFNDLGIDPGLIRIATFADSYIIRNEHLDNVLLDPLSTEKPIYFKITRDSDFYEVCLIFAIDDIDELFNLNNNNAEKYIIKDFIKSIYLESSDLKEDEIEVIANEFIENTIPLGKPKFRLERLAPLNEGILNYSDPIETSEIIKMNTEELISQFLMDNEEVIPGTYTNNQAKDIIDKIFAFIQSKIESEIQKYNKNSILYFCYCQLEFLRNYRESMEIEFGMASKSDTDYDVVHEKKRMLENVIIRNNSLQHLLETILRTDTPGDKDPSNEDFQYLEALSTVSFNLASISDLIHYKITPHKIIIKDNYLFEISEEEVVIDGDRYLTDVSKWGLKDDYTKYERAKMILEIEKGEKKELPSEYDDINNVFEMDYGFNYSEFLKVIGAMSAINPPNTHFYPLVYMEEELLLKEIKTIIEDTLDDSTILNVINFISMDYNSFKSHDPFIPNLLRMNQNRFNLKPLIKFSDVEESYYLFGSCSVYSTGGIYSHLISTGRFPYFIDETTPLGVALKSMEQLHNNDLEKKVEDISIKLFGKNNVELRLKNFHRINKKLPKDPPCGEIDCLTIDIDKKIIHVLEAKDVKKGINPKEIKNETKKYFDPKGKNYAGKLIKKADFVSQNLEIFLDHFNISDKEGWTVNYAFVTYEVHMSSALSTNNVEFIPLSELEDYLSKLNP